MKEYADKKAYVKPSKLKEVDAVLLKNPRPFNSTPYQPIDHEQEEKDKDHLSVRTTASDTEQQLFQEITTSDCEEAGLEPPATSEDEENHLRAVTSY